MIIRSVRHRGLQRLIDDNNPRFLPLQLVQRIRNVLAALMLAENFDSFLIGTPQGWRTHRLSGRREAEWSVSVSGNWRITFTESDGYIDNLNLEDYH